MQYKTYSRQIVYTLVLFGLLVLSGKSCLKRFQDKFWSRGSNPDSSAGQKHLSGHTSAKNKDSSTSLDPAQETLDVGAGAKCDKGQGGGSGCYIPPPPSSPSVEEPYDGSVVILQERYENQLSSFLFVYEASISSSVDKALDPEMSHPMLQELNQQVSGQRLDKEVSNVVEGLDVEKKGLNLENKESLDQPVSQKDSEEVVTDQAKDDGGGTLEKEQDSHDPLMNGSEEMGGMVDQKDHEGGELEEEGILESLEENGLEGVVRDQDKNDDGGKGDSCRDESDPVSGKLVS